MRPVTGEMNDLPAFKETGFILRFAIGRLDDMLGHVLQQDRIFRPSAADESDFFHCT